MTLRRLAAIAAIVVGTWTMTGEPTAGATDHPATVVRQVDHVLIVSREAEQLFSLLADTFELPVAWPLSDYGGFVSGGVAVGDVNLEIIQDSAPATGGAPPRWSGFALEPEPLRISLAELDARGVPYGKPAPFRSIQRDGSMATLWTTVALPKVSCDEAAVFLCEYGHDAQARRRRRSDELRSRNGGALSVQSMSELAYGVREVQTMRRQWQRLLDPLPASSPGSWRLKAGPAIRVVSAERNGLQGLSIKVASLGQARRFLSEHGMLGAEEPSAVTVGGRLLDGLNVTLAEGAPAGRPE